MKKNDINIDVIFSDIDSMMIAHNSRYYVWFETARFAFSYNVLDFKEEDLLVNYKLPVIRSNCKYLRAVCFRDTLCVTTYIYINETAKIGFYYVITNQHKLECAIGSTQHAILSGENKKMTKLDQKLANHLAQIQTVYPECFMTKEQVQFMENRINR